LPFHYPSRLKPEESDLEIDSWEDLEQLAADREYALIRATTQDPEEIYDLFLLVEEGYITAAHLDLIRSGEERHAEEAIDTFRQLLERGVTALADLYELDPHTYELLRRSNPHAQLKEPLRTEKAEEEVDLEAREREREELLQQLGIDLEAIEQTAEALLEDYLEEYDPVEEAKRMLRALGAQDVELHLTIRVPSGIDDRTLQRIQEDLRSVLPESIDDLNVEPSLKEREAITLRIQRITKRLLGG